MKFPEIFKLRRSVDEDRKDVSAVSRGGGLFSEQAIENLAAMMFRVTDPDYTLEKAGLTRADLRKLESDDEISGALETRREAVLGTPWRLEDGVTRHRQFVEQEIAPWITALLSGAWSAVPYGYSVVEVVYRRRTDGLIGIDHLGAKPFEWFEPQKDGELKYYQADGARLVDGRVVDTSAKFLLTRRNATYRNPFGEALLSRIYWAWFMRVHGWEFWARYLERHGAPLLVGKGAVSKDAANDLVNMLVTAVQSGVAAVGTNIEVEAVTTGNAGNSFSLFGAAVDKRVQKLILGQTLTTDVDGKGSYAAANVHDRVRQDKKIADCRMVGDTVQQLVNALTWLNWPAAQPAAFNLEDPRGLERERADRDKVLHETGVRFTKDYFMNSYDLEEDDLDLAADAAPPTPAGERQTLAIKLAAKGSGRKQRFTEDQEEVEGLVEAALAEARSPLSAEQLREAILQADDASDLVERLAAIYTGDSINEFRELMERTLFAADVLGYETASTGRGQG